MQQVNTLIELIFHCLYMVLWIPAYSPKPKCRCHKMTIESCKMK